MPRHGGFSVMHGDLKIILKAFVENPSALNMIRDQFLDAKFMRPNLGFSRRAESERIFCKNPYYRSNRCRTVRAGTMPWDVRRFDDRGRVCVVRACEQQWLSIIMVRWKTDNGNGVFEKGYYANLYFYGGTLWSMTHKRYPFGPAFRYGTTFFQQRAFPIPFPPPTVHGVPDVRTCVGTCVSKDD